jgi:hypothetical protein
MKKFYRNQRRMFYVVERFLSQADPAILAQMPGMAAAVMELQDIIQEIAQTSSSRLLGSSGLTLGKQERKEVMCRLAYTVGMRLQCYAMDSGQPTLFKMGISFSVLQRQRSTVCADHGNRVYSRAEEHLAALAPYVVTAAMLQELRDAIDDFVDWIPKPRVAIVNRKCLTSDLYGLVRKGMKLLDRVDVYVASLKFTEPSFYEHYRSRRKLVRYGVRHLSLRGVVRNEQGDLLAHVKVSIPELGLESKTTDRGYFQVKRVKEGIRRVVFERTGYESLEQMTAVVRNQRTDLVVVMERGFVNVFVS